MAAPIRQGLRMFSWRLFRRTTPFVKQISKETTNQRRLFFSKSKCNGSWGSSKTKIVLGSVALTAGFVTLDKFYRDTKYTVFASAVDRPKHAISRSIRVKGDTSGLKLTLYQYQNCPFCCKVRATLDYFGFSYDVIEVNSVTKSQLKWSTYKKVPIMVCDGVGQDGFLQLNDSSVIMSILGSYLVDKSQGLERVTTFYPGIEAKNSRGKTVWEFPNKYFIMFGSRKSKATQEQEKEERKWRQWTDECLVHTLSPNVYRTITEARQAFNYFSEVGEWENNFSTPNRLFIITVGSTAMYFIGKILKKRHNLKEDVRQSLYDAVNDWLKAIGPNRKFMGGDIPNFADLSVYGVLSSVEGCDAFQDTLQNTNLQPWYSAMKKATQSHMGLGQALHKD
ncbi:hypothetical protein ACJMK2_042526 [Sinanodonta woodiana]|uniref:Glutaredoxin domain-containing protein n=1 Tax=Sinanodonta woodiana TaxID=1069815 RepID=A0ABD3W7L5_SINWO